MFAAYCVSLAVRTKAQALAILILIWLAAVLLYGPGAAGCGRILYGRLAARRFERLDAC